MKIAIFTESYLPQVTAVETQAFILKRELEKLDCEPLLVTSNMESEECYLENGILHCPAKPSGSIHGQSARRSKLLHLNSYLDDFSPDIIHLLTFGEIGEAGLKYALAHDLPLMTTIHNLKDVNEGYEGNKIVNLVSKNFCQGVLKKALAFSDIVASASSMTEDQIRLYSTNCKIDTVPLCVDTELFHLSAVTPEAKKAMAAKLGLSGKTGILTVGRLDGDSCLEQLLEDWAKAVSPTDRLHLVIVGSGPDSEYLQEKANVLGISKQITFAGNIPHEQINACYESCVAFVSAATSPFMKAAPLEAIFCGLPVILRKQSASAAFITEGINGFFYEDAEKLGDLLKMLSNLTPEKEELLRKLVNKTASNMTLENQINAFIRQYQRTQELHYQKNEDLE